MATLVSLAWQFAIWKWSGVRIKPTAYSGSFIGGATDPIAVIGVQATNKGRGACEVTQWYFDDGTDKKIVVPQCLPGSAPKPTKLEGLHSLTWYIPQDSFKEAVQRAGMKRVRPVVIIGSGKHFRGKWVSIESLTRGA
ncbi:hypothetical protein [Streptomyces kanamyceticus]|uniref:hypothetical protein n=1 Tax=Streptomyces kanamyceticus TaxID=1967 RepID=UPI00123DDD8A|nr:hypothetical protein [Streptomyces kanamyceticus]